MAWILIYISKLRSFMAWASLLATFWCPCKFHFGGCRHLCVSCGAQREFKAAPPGKANGSLQLAGTTDRVEGSQKQPTAIQTKAKGPRLPQTKGFLKVFRSCPKVSVRFSISFPIGVPKASQRFSIGVPQVSQRFPKGFPRMFQRPPKVSP